MVIGNSSSGLIEAPSFQIPTVNIGNRQKGRVRAESVIDCKYGENDIINAIEQARRIKNENTNIVNPYEGDNTSKTIYKIMKRKLENDINARKQFFNIGENYEKYCNNTSP